MKTYKIAFAGFRHGHINSLYHLVKERSDCSIVGLSEADPASREAIASSLKIDFTHSDAVQMMEEVSPDVLVIGDIYSLRGGIALRALERKIHIIVDKPICTSLEDLEAIETAAAAGNLSVGCMLDQREAPPFLTMKDLIRKGTIGDVVTLNFMGQHPLLRDTRPGWYFEPGCHGGTINDIGIHAFDMAVWLTNSPWETTTGARSWNAKAVDVPHFLDSAQIMGKLKNGVGVLADFSYLAPDQLGYGLPQYWRLTVHGTKGIAETHYNAKEVTVVGDADSEPQSIPLLPTEKGTYLNDFFAEIEGIPSTGGLTTNSIIESSRQALLAQAQSLQ